MLKRVTRGTHRVARPEETLARIQPLTTVCGITRLADVTDLDTIGIPVVMAVRPLARTLTVSQGKGIDLPLAKVSAVMESIELWHAEENPPATRIMSVPAADLDLPYPVSTLAQHPGSLLTDHVRLDWVIGRGLRTGADVPVPADAVRLRDDATRLLRPSGIRPSSNGLASGNTAAEAAVHAIYELIERDHLAGSGPDGSVCVDAATVSDDVCRPLLDRLSEARVSCEVNMLRGDWSVACFTCYLWSPDCPVVACGAGAHSDPSVALARAVTEAAQNRLTVISGTRDDIAPVAYSEGFAEPQPPTFRTPVVAWDELDFAALPVFDHDDDEFGWLIAQLHARCAGEPVFFDLSTDDAVAVVKVIAPGVGFVGRHGYGRADV